VAINFLNIWLLLLIVPAVLFVLWTAYKAGRIKSAKAKWSTALRCLILLLLIFSLAGMSIRKYTDETTVVFAVDLSDSTAAAREDMAQFILDSLKQKPDKFQAGIVTFGKEALVEQPVARELAFYELETMPPSHFTNMDHGLQTANSLMPGDTRKRVVLLTDGNQNLGDGIARARLLSQQGIRVDGVFFDTRPEEEVQISSLSLPGYLYQGESYDIQVGIDSTVSTSGILRLYANRQLLSEQRVEIQKGENRFIFKDTAREGGIKTYEAELQVEKDHLIRNNRMAAYVNVKGIPMVAVVEGLEGESRELLKILDAAGIQTKLYTPQTLPADLEELRKYQAMVLNNVSADDLNEKKIEAIESYVKSLGRGLLVTGGDNSYALGGYMGTLLEDLLPVDMDLTQKADIPSLGLVVVIDKSGSMTEGRFGVTKLDLAKEAAIRSTEALRPRDYIGVIAFDDAASWVVETRSLDDLQRIQDDIGTIRPGGGTNMYPGLNLAFESLKNLNTKLKHVIVLTDGMSAPGDFEGLVQKMSEQGITLSTVAVGQDSDVRLLENLAQIGNGRFYFTDEFQNIPKIFTKETYLATQSYVQNHSFYPVVTGISPILSGFDEGFPPLHGYIATGPKPSANVILSSDKSDPILAEWQYGLGRVLSWTSDLRGIWTEDWITWEEGQDFWLNIVSRLLPGDDSTKGTVETRRLGDQGIITVELGEGLGEDFDSKAVIVDPEGGQREIDLKLTEPGKYEGNFDIDLPGVYLVRVEQRKDGKVISSLDSGLSVTYSPEYDIRLKSSEDFLRRLVEETGGRILEKPEEVFRDDLEPVWAQTELSPYLLPLALVLFALDIAIRRLRIEALLVNLRRNMEGRKKASMEAAEKRKAQEAEKPTNGSRGYPTSFQEKMKPDEGRHEEKAKEKHEEPEEKGKEEEQGPAFTSQLLNARQRHKRKKL